jgi:hypothetical protein
MPPIVSMGRMNHIAVDADDYLQMDNLAGADV